MYRSNRFLLIMTASLLAWFSLLFAGALRAQDSVPVSEAWNIASSGKAGSSGELLFRLTPGNGDDPTEVTVFVLSGTNETGVASSIRRAMNTQLNAARFNVQAGEGANVLVTPARADDKFALELIDSDVENVSVIVRSASPVAPPTVPAQNTPANPPPPATPPAPGSNDTPAGQTPAQSSTPPAQPSAPPAQPSAPPDTPSEPPDSPSNAGGGAGAPASAPPPPPGN
jgi:hypothetical protein